MTEEPEKAEATPIACSLGVGDLRGRQLRLAELGRASLLGADGGAGRHRLRFRGDAGTRAALEGIVEAESECCPFLALSIGESGGELTLSIEAQEGGEEIADALAASFRGAERPSGRERPERDRSPLMGVGAGALALVCCLAGPLVLGAAAGSLVGGTLEVVAAALAVTAVVLFIRRQRSGGGDCR
jgi:hypothetical protein